MVESKRQYLYNKNNRKDNNERLQNKGKYKK
jgi:hypothetical protein